MGYCICCGKTLSALSNPPVQLSSNVEGEFCMRCFNNLIDYLYPLENTKSLSDFNQYAESLLQRIHELKYRPEVEEAIQKHIDSLKGKIIHSYEQERLRKTQERLRETFLTTTSFNFEGYSIVKYKGVFNESVVLGTGFMSELKGGFSDFFGTSSEAFSDKIDIARNAAMTKLIDKAIVSGCNALIGIDFDYLALGNNMIGVVSSGTGVIIQQISEKNYEEDING